MKKISPTKITEVVIERAKILKRKKEIYEEVIKFDKELETLDESYQGMLGTFGFKMDGDISNKSKTGFVNDFQQISRVAELAKEMEEQDTISEDTMDEMAKLKQENEQLKAKLKDLEK